MSATAPVVVFTVLSGPFQGLEATSAEVVTKLDDYSAREYAIWDTHARTRHFLSVFPPAQGWKVQVERTDLRIAMDDHSIAAVDGRAVQNPVWLFTASLLDKENNVVASGSAAQLINCPMAFEMAETRARGKLYTALGLPGNFTPSTDEFERPLATPTPAQQTMPLVTPVALASAPQPVAAPVESDQALPAVDTAEARLDLGSETDPSNLDDAGSPEDDVPAADASPDFTRDDAPDLPAVAVMPPAAPAVQGPQTPAAIRAQQKASGEIPAALLRQIQLRADRAKKVVPAFESLKHAQDFLAELVNPAAKRDLVSEVGEESA